MPALAYGTGAYRRSPIGLPELMVRNLYIERTPVTGEQPVLIGRPALQLSRTDGATRIRGLFQWDGVLGGQLLAFGPSVMLGTTALGTLPGTDRVRAAAGEGEVLATAAGGLYRVIESGFEPVAFPDSAPVADVAFLRGRFVAVRADTGQFYWSDILDGTTIDGLSFATAEKQADPLVAVLTVGDEIWLFGTRTVEPWGPNSDADLPFAPTPGRIYQEGCAARDTAVALDNTAYWVSDRRQVVRGGPTVTEIVSTPSIAERLADVDAESLSAWGFAWRGHAFYALRIEGQGTFVYDISTGEWAEWDSYGEQEWLAHVGCHVGATVYAGSAETGEIWTLSDEVSTDNGQPIVREFTALAPVMGGQTVTADSVEVGALVGRGALGENPQMEMRRSRDGGFLWSEWRGAPMGAEGEYRTRCVWRRLGQIDAPGMVLQFRCSDEAPVRVSRVTLNEAAGGRSR